jgi:hypothetical protein
MAKTASSIFKTFLLSLLIVGQVHFAYAQTASLLPNAVQQFFDNNGNPLTSGTVTTYIPSTGTLKTTWQDSGKVTPWANPLTLNAAGRPPNDKGIYGDGSYRQLVKDRNGNIIWDQTTSSTGSGSTATTSTGDGDLVGTIKPWAGMTAPNQYAFTYGQELNRTTFATLYTAITSTQAVFCNSGSPILNGLSDTTNFWIGMQVEVSCSGLSFTTIIGKTATTVTMAVNANVTTNVSATFFPWGGGNHTTTFNLPDFRGLIPVGNNNMGGVASANLTTTYYGPAGPDSIGGIGGAQSKTLSLANLPAQTPAGNITSTLIDGGAVFYGFNVPGTNVGFGGVATGGDQRAATAELTINSSFTGTPFPGQSNTAFSGITPSRTANYIIKTTPDTNSASASGVTSLGSMTGDIACGTGILCTGNIISSNVIPLGTSGGIPYYNTTTTVLSSGLLTANQLVLGGGAGTSPATLGSLGTTSTLLHGNAGGAPAFGSVVAADLSAALIANATDYAAGTSSTTLITPSIIYPSETTTTFGTTTTFNFATFINTAVTLTANITTQTLSNVVAGKAGSIRFIQSGAGSFTTVWNSIFKFAGGTTPTLTTGSTTAIDVLSYNCITATYCQATLAKDVK